MAYPRCCPRCGAAYDNELDHMTVRAEPGGTPSPWRPQQPGRRLVLLCLACRHEYLWDYFADARDAAPEPRGVAPAIAPPRRAPPSWGSPRRR